mmetsp:Transcript_15149/g.37245  ORF Transcript_15149/g.37245 Transcript_15149/m.37245 type:complete len:222 (+) Transcript_15149:126-791(+)
MRLPAPLVLTEGAAHHEEDPVRVPAHDVHHAYLGHGPPVCHHAHVHDVMPGVAHQGVELHQRLADEMVVVIHVGAEAKVPRTDHVSVFHRELPHDLHPVPPPGLVDVAHGIHLQAYGVLDVLHLVREEQRARNVLRVPANSQTLGAVLLHRRVHAKRTRLGRGPELRAVDGHHENLLCTHAATARNVSLHKPFARRSWIGCTREATRQPTPLARTADDGSR